jgi:hypothetical protein
MDWMWKMVESSRGKEEDENLELERANDQLLSTHLPDSPLYPLS